MAPRHCALQFLLILILMATAGFTKDHTSRHLKSQRRQMIKQQKKPQEHPFLKQRQQQQQSQQYPQHPSQKHPSQQQANNRYPPYDVNKNENINKLPSHHQLAQSDKKDKKKPPIKKSASKTTGGNRNAINYDASDSRNKNNKNKNDNNNKKNPRNGDSQSEAGQGRGFQQDFRQHDNQISNELHPMFDGGNQHNQLTPEELARSFLSNDDYARLLQLDRYVTTESNMVKGNGDDDDDNEDGDGDDSKTRKVFDNKRSRVKYVGSDNENEGYHQDSAKYDGNVDDIIESDDSDYGDDGERRKGGWGNGDTSPNNNSFETLFRKHFATYDRGQVFYPARDIHDQGGVGSRYGDGDGDDISTSSYISFLDLGVNDVLVTDCPKNCMCQDTEVNCAAQGITSVPEDISPLTTMLDLSLNNLNRLPENSFAHLPNLEQLQCVGCNLTRLPRRLFKYNTLLRVLNLQGNKFVKVPSKALQDLQYLLELHLDANKIQTIPRSSFKGLFRLQQLRLDANHLDHIPLAAMRELTGLQAVTFAGNNISKVPTNAFQNNTRLIHIILSNNQIKTIEDNAFFGPSRLKYLQLERNLLREIPTSLYHVTKLEELNLQRNRLSHLPDKSFQFKEKLSMLGLRNNPIKSIGDKVFSHLPSLTELILSEVHELENFPDLTGTNNLIKVQLDRANIKSLPKDLCLHMPNITSFDVHSNKIGTIPNMSLCLKLSNLNMGNNELTSLDGQLFKGLSLLRDLTLSNNFIHTIPDDAFVGLSSLEYLNLAENQISFIHPDAFIPLMSLTDLNLGENHISHLPTAGLAKLVKLKVFHNKELREFPPKEDFPHVKHFVLAYAYHCCDFIHSRTEQSNHFGVRERIIWMGGFNAEGRWRENDTDSWPIHSIRRRYKNMTIDKNHDVVMGILGENNEFSFSSDTGHIPYYQEGYNYEMIHNKHPENSSEFAGIHHYEDGIYDNEVILPKASISCRPKPGPFMPCDDLFGWWSLRCGVWIVFLLALLGNFVVFFVSVTSRSKMDVPRFLICNLALADFFMGIYLGMLAIVDASTLGQFKKYAIQWQMSPGCLVAGFLGVFSSELSVFTLTVITLERFYAITHAMQLNKRLSLKHSSVIMLGGWIFCFGIATMPLFGISDYRKFAICLPFEIEDLFAKGYVCFIMTFNGIAFFIILSCYLIMYISIRDSQAWNSNETRVAKRMALLVFTDFVCWAPIAFLSLASAFGKHLIHLNEAKVLTIFILPLNSCANPFLYAFFTKQFKKDCVLFCRRLEDSSIARHFSQVSQRHVSVSWKCQRRQSGLNSLMGDGKSQNSQNNSNASNSYGLVNNYNSEVSSGTNKDANVNDTWAKDVKSTFRSAHKPSGKSQGKTVDGIPKGEYKYSRCPLNDTVDGLDNQTESRKIYPAPHVIGGVRRMGDAQVTLHEDPYPQQNDTRIHKSKGSNDSTVRSNNTVLKQTKQPCSLSQNQGWPIDEAYGIISDEESSVWKKMTSGTDENNGNSYDYTKTSCTTLPASPTHTKLGSVDSYYSVERPKHSPQKAVGKGNTTTKHDSTAMPVPGENHKALEQQNQQKKEKSQAAPHCSTKHKRRKHIQCCSANSSPIDCGDYEFASQNRKRAHKKENDRKRQKPPHIQYVMTMPEEMLSNKNDVDDPKLANVLKYVTTNDKLFQADNVANKQTVSFGDKIMDTNSFVSANDTSQYQERDDSIRLAERDTVRNCKTHNPGDNINVTTNKTGMTAPNPTEFPVLTREFLHHHTAIDKSVHLRYFQQSIAGHDFLCKSNSLVELTQSQIEDAQMQSINAVTNKRGSLSSHRDGYMMLSEETGESLVHSYRQQNQYCVGRNGHACCGHYRQSSTGEVSDDVCSRCISPDITTDVYSGEQMSGSIEEGEFYHSIRATELLEGFSCRNVSSDWKDAKREEIGGLLADSDTDDLEGKHDSISSTRLSADKESGFHSQI